MTRPQSSLLARHDTFLGVCQGVGENLHIHPNVLRVAFGVAFFFAPLAAAVTYLVLGLTVAATHYALPIDSAAPPSVTARQPVERDIVVDATHDQVRLAA